MKWHLLLLFILLSMQATAQTINRAEYFLDHDPGTGNGVNVPIVPGAQIDLPLNIPTGLSAGFHTFNFRVMDDQFHWSHFASRVFYVEALSISTTITESEYFFDHDPGTGNGVNVPVVPGAQIDVPLNIPTTGLSAGFHTFNFRVKNDQLHWSHFASRVFYVDAVSISTAITAGEYFIDHDPGTGNGTGFSITSGPDINQTLPVNPGAISPGFHQLCIRYQDNRGVWSHFSVHTFYIIPPDLLPANDLVRIEYYLDNENTPYGTGTNLLAAPAASVDQVFPIDLSSVPAGNHLLFIRARDSQGFWSNILSSPFLISTCVPPAPPVAGNIHLCGEGTAVLTASGASGSQEYRWYDDALSTTPIGTGPSFTTEFLTSGKSYFVSIHDPVTACESVRSTVAVTVSLSPPHTPETISGSRCGEGSVTLSATGAIEPQQYRWYDNNTDITPIGTNAPFTTPSLTATHSYFVSIYDPVTGCESSRTASVAEIINGDVTIIKDDNLLIASQGDQYQWFLNNTLIENSTSQTLEIGALEFGIYAVEVINGTCSGRSEDFFYLITDRHGDPATGLTIAPNPVKNHLMVKNFRQETVKLVLFDSQAKAVLKKDVLTGEHEYDLTALAQGIYFALVETASGLSAIKIVKL